MLTVSKMRLNYPEFIQVVKSYDIFCVIETHPDDTAIIEINGFSYFAKH